jgi:hypothetical protein
MSSSTVGSSWPTRSQHFIHMPTVMPALEAALDPRSASALPSQGDRSLDHAVATARQVRCLCGNDFDQCFADCVMNDDRATREPQLGSSTAHRTTSPPTRGRD